MARGAHGARRVEPRLLGAELSCHPSPPQVRSHRDFGLRIGHVQRQRRSLCDEACRRTLKLLVDGPGALARFGICTRRYFLKEASSRQYFHHPKASTDGPSTDRRHFPRGCIVRRLRRGHRLAAARSAACREESQSMSRKPNNARCPPFWVAVGRDGKMLGTTPDKRWVTWVCTMRARRGGVGLTASVHMAAKVKEP
jgi:hypothetical protein